MKKALLSSMVVGMCVFTPYSFAMTTLNDEELSDVEGQALLSMEVQRGYNQADDLGTNYDQSNISFYKLGLEAEMEINTNIKSYNLVVEVLMVRQAVILILIILL